MEGRYEFEGADVLPLVEEANAADERMMTERATGGMMPVTSHEGGVRFLARSSRSGVASAGRRSGTWPPASTSTRPTRRRRTRSTIPAPVRRRGCG
jgi:hypothetical protein